MKTMNKFLSMAALALVGAVMASCSSDDDFANDNKYQSAKTGKIETLTTTVSLDGSATTRALSIEGNKGVKTFAVGETMAVIYNNGTFVKAVSHTLEAGDITNEGKNATFTFDLENPDKNGTVQYIYPAAMAGDTNVDITKLNTQEGTFDALQSKYDFCTNSGVWDGENLPSLTLENQLAILAITLKDEAGTSDITSSITGLTLSEGTKTYTVNRSAAAGPIYVAIQSTSGATITVNATDGSKNYTKTLTGKTYEAGNGYPVSWRMAKAPATAYTLAESTVGMIVGSDGNAYAVEDKDNLPTGVTAVAMVAYKSATAGSSLAIALADEGSMNWATAKSTCEGKTAIGVNSWKLPSKDEWNNMISAAGSYTALRDGFNGIGGTNMQSSEYWSSTERASDNAWDYDFEDGDWTYDLKGLGDGYVRACLAF